MTVREKLVDSATRTEVARLLKAKTGEDVIVQPTATAERSVAADGSSSSLWRRFLPWEVVLICLGALALACCCGAAAFLRYRRNKKASEQQASLRA